MIWQARELTRVLRNAKRSEAELAQVQTAKLRRSIRYAYENVPYYRERFGAAGITPADIRSLADLRHVPQTTKGDLIAAGTEATTLNALATPMIRYRIGDVLTTRPGRCPCGRPFPLVGDPEGRESDLVVLPSGRVLTPQRFDALNGIRQIAEYQLVQDAGGGLTLKLVVRPGGAEGVVDEARARTTSYLGEPVALEVHTVETLERSGVKLRTFVSMLARERAPASSSRSPSG
jgi:phenylacetate-coenzyme A ligase PaaK-like adenylate-forming protein